MVIRKQFLLAQSVGLIILLIGLVWNVSATGGTLQAGLQNRLNNMGPDDVETVIVVMANQPTVIQNTTDRYLQLTTLYSETAQEQASVMAYVAAQQLTGRVSGIHAYKMVNAISLTASRDVIEAIAARSDVEVVTENHIIPLPPVSTAPGPLSTQYGIRLIKADKVWDTFNIRGEGVTVGSVDTGVDVTHPDLVSRYRGGPKGFYDAIGDSMSIPFDRAAHGTHVHGTMIGGNASGVAIGVAPDAKWIAAGAFSNQGGATDAILRAFDYMADPDGDPNTDDAPDVVNNSWGGGGQSDVFKPGIVNWISLGIFPAFANGNSGPGSGTVGYPAYYAESFGVGALDSTGTIAGFSSRGPSPSGEIKPEVSAPGVAVLSSVPNGEYARYNGTSMATPHVSGAIALLRQANPSISVAEIREVLETTAIDKGATGEDNDYGHGLIDVYEAVKLVADGMGTLSGTVTEGAVSFGQDPASVPVPGVRVMVITQPDSGRQILTGTDGKYSFLVPAGHYSIQASRDGYATMVDTVTVVDDSTHVLNYVLEPVYLKPSHTSFKDTLNAGQEKTHTLNISNPGAGTLKFTVGKKYALSGQSGPKPLPAESNYMTVTPESGEIGANGNIDLTVKVNSTGLANYTYTADIRLTSNDPNQPVVTVADTLLVQNAGNGQISITPSSLTASIEPDSTTVRNITIKNSGAGPLQVFNIVDDAQWVSESPRYYLIPKNDSTQIAVTFNAASLVGGSTHTANITVSSTDPNNGTVTVPVTLNILAPDIVASPASFVFRMDADKTLDKLLTISNNGNGVLRYKAKIEERQSGTQPSQIGDRGDAPLNKARARETYRSARKSPEGSSGPPATSRSGSPSPSPTFESLLGGIPDQGTTSGSIKVLIAPADNASKIQALLAAFPDFETVDYFDARNATPTIAKLKEYNVVVTWPNYQYSDKLAFGNRLGDFAEDGGSVVLMTFTHFSGGVTGRILDHAAFGGGGANWYSFADLGEHDKNHPLMEDVDALRDTYRDKGLTLKEGATLVASWADGEYLAAVNKAGNVVGLNFYTGDHLQWTGDGTQLLRNSLVNASGGGLSWISLTPKNGEVAPSGKIEVTVTFNTTDLPDSLFLANIILESNDPDSVLIVPVDLTVGGYPVVMTDLRTSNSSSQHITVGWKTDVAADGLVHFGLNADSLNTVAKDIRGVDFNGTVHAVAINNLLANTMYYYKIESAGNEQTTDVSGNPLVFTTAKDMVSVPGINLIGLVNSENGIQVGGANLYIQLSRDEEISQALSMLTTTENPGVSYSLNLGNLKNAAGEPWKVNALDQIILHAQGGDKGFAARNDLKVINPSETFQNLGVLKLRSTLDVLMTFPRGFSIRSTPGIPANPLTSADFLKDIPAQQVSRWLRDQKVFDNSINVENRIFNGFQIELGDSYFVKVDTLRSYNLAVFSLGDSVVQTDLKSGLNMISTPIGISYTSHSLIGDINTASEVVRWQPTKQAYDSAFDIGQGVVIGKNFVIESGKGYFLRVSGDFIWSIDGDGSTGPTQVATRRLSPSDRLAFLSDYPATTLANTTLAKVNGSKGGSVGDQVTVTNLTPVSATVVWMTHQETTGRLVYSQKDQIERVMTEKIPSQIHWVELTDLSPGTEYTIQVGEQTHVFTTPGFNQGMSYTVFGRIADTVGQPSVNTLVMIRATDESGVSSLPLAAVTDSLGFWNINLGNLKTDQGTAFVWQVGQMLDVEIANTINRTALQIQISGESPQSTTVRAVSTAGANVPQSFSLAQSYPNPFNPTTTIRYEIPKTVHVELSIYNILGQKVAILVNETQQPGRYEVRWSGRNAANAAVASGIYLYRLSAGAFSSQMKMLLLK